jgi:3D (Asp-Asp-Asp) domain-containing protein
MILWTVGCVTEAIRSPPAGRCIVVPMELTGYCNCGKCCNWESTWFGGPVIASGPHKGEPKKVGFTSCGAEARHGTLAADIARYPYGTIVEVPGYGFGRVEDSGRAIKGDHMDLWFPEHDQALQWGHQRKLVKIWLPSGRR